MVNRVKFQGGALASLKVSLPGYDVDTATFDQLAFDARFANMTLIMSGKIFCPWETWTTVYFPTTYSTIPRAFLGYNNSGGSSASPSADPTRIVCPGAVLTSGSGTYLWMNIAFVTTSYMQFYPALWVDPSYPDDEEVLIRSFANAYFHYAVYR